MQNLCILCMIIFDVRIEQPNKKMIAAMLEAKRIARDPSAKRYSDAGEALRALRE